MSAPSNVGFIFDGDIRNSKAEYVVQQCNCTGKTYLGLSKVLVEAFPHADFYKRKAPSTPGTIEVRGSKKDKTRYVVALYAQLNPGKPKKGDTATMRQKWFKECLGHLAQIKGLTNASVCFPYKIGCGLAGGDWTFYKQAIEDWAKNNPSVKVRVVSNAPEPAEPVAPEASASTTKVAPSAPASSSTPVALEGDAAKAMAILERMQNSLDEARWLLTQHFAAQPTSTLTLVPVTVVAAPQPTWSNASLADYTAGHIPKGWEAFFNERAEVVEDVSSDLAAEVKKGHTLFPPLHQVYTAFDLCAPDEIKVVIIGQDPYHGPGQAMGLAFSVPDGEEIPSSLSNIYRELKSDGFTPTAGGDLSLWTTEGVFLINTALTVRAHQANAHAKAWETFTDQLFRYLNETCEHLVVIMWGTQAQKYAARFDDGKHRKIKSAHPSGLSADKGFFGSAPFSKANAYLKKWGVEPINWNLA